ncbi:ribokinase [Pseudactinotalea sp. Z1732]|uniref:ribokinase n=1 Tax=Pseudactinotalea sp. Z1732 TaxID=3413026 RepID=UPI003C7CFEF1
MSGSVQVCVVASFMYDMVATAPRMPEIGETLMGTGFATYVGGKGFNQAIAAARAGATTGVIGRVGLDPFAAEFREFLQTEGIDDGNLAADGEHGTGVGLPVVDAHGRNAIIIVPRANHALSAQDIEAAREKIAAAAVLVLQLEVPIAPVVHAARIARAAGTTVILNPAPYAPLPPELVELVDVLVPNEVELRQMVPGEGALDRAAEMLQLSSGCAVVVTCGAAGLLVVGKEGRLLRVPAHEVQVADTIGAGDAFCGNLGARLALGDALLTAVRYANAAAALAVTRPGGAPAAPTATETERFVASRDRSFKADP